MYSMHERSIPQALIIHKIIHVHRAQKDDLFYNLRKGPLGLTPKKVHVFRKA